MKTRNVVVVGVDGSPESFGAVAWAAREARRQDSPLRIVHVWHLPVYPTDPIITTPDPDRDTVNKAVTVAVAAAPSVQCDLRTPSGPSALTLLAECDDASLIVIGGHHRTLLDRMTFGSVTTHVLSNAPCPVVIVRERQQDEEQPFVGPVVVGVDHGESSFGALAYAFDYASRNGRELVAVQAWSAHELTDNAEIITIDAAQRALAEKLEPLHGAYPHVSVVTVAVCDSPVNALLDWADRAELLVVGSRGRGYFAGILLGSVSAAVAHQSPSSVAVIR